MRRKTITSLAITVIALVVGCISVKAQAIPAACDIIKVPPIVEELLLTRETNTYFDEVNEHFIELLSAEKEVRGLTPTIVIEEWTQKYADIRAEELVTDFSCERPNNAPTWGCECIVRLDTSMSPAETAEQAFNSLMQSAPASYDLMCEDWEFWGVASSEGGLIVSMYAYENEQTRECNITPYRLYLEDSMK